MHTTTYQKSPLKLIIEMMVNANCLYYYSLLLGFTTTVNIVKKIYYFCHKNIIIVVVFRSEDTLYNSICLCVSVSVSEKFSLAPFKERYIKFLLPISIYSIIIMSVSHVINSFATYGTYKKVFDAEMLEKMTI